MVHPHDRYWPNNKSVGSISGFAQRLAIELEGWQDRNLTEHRRIQCESEAAFEIRTNGRVQVVVNLPPMRTIRRSADSMEGAEMLRKGLVALMMGVICAGSAVAADSAARKPNPAPTGLAGWWKNKVSGHHTASAVSRLAEPHTVRTKSRPKPGGIERAVVQDAERQSVAVHQTSGSPQDSQDRPPQASPGQVQSALQPVPIEVAPVLPNISTVSGPQYFSAMPAGSSNVIPVHPGSNWQTYQAPTQIQNVSQRPYAHPTSSTSPAGPAHTSGGMMTPQPQGGYYPMSSQGRYPQTGAALYPSPIPGIPQQMGGAAIMHPAFHPHEMLYGHEYHAMYPPYYYKVNGGFLVSPFGVWSHEDWKLEGTRVDVKYNSHISPFTLFHPPFSRSFNNRSYDHSYSH